MAKANQFAHHNRTLRRRTSLPHKIPIEDRKSFMGTNTWKWVSKVTWKRYLEWVKKGKPKIN